MRPEGEPGWRGAKDPSRAAGHYRYPGPDSFQDDDTDRRLFFGREEEISELLNRLPATRLLVLYGKSGLGKTSLLQAGLFPRLRERDLLPLRIRLNRRDSSVLSEVRAAAEAACQAQGVAYSPGHGDTLWEFLNTALFSRGDRFLTPVLVFDQFEEVFTLQGPDFRRSLSRELGYLLTGAIPPAVRERRKRGQRPDHPPRAPDVRILLSLREEHVGALQELAEDVPAILEHRFRLRTLDKDRAREAIEYPSGLDDERVFATRPFRYAPATRHRPGAVDEMLDFLQGHHGEIEPFQLQILCRHVERGVARRQARGERNVTVEVGPFLGGPKGMQGVLKRFYREAIRDLPGWSRRRRARRLCEYGLLSPEGYRESLGQGRIEREYRLREEALGQLVDAKVLRREARLESFYYEISHDSLARAVKASRRFRVPTAVKVATAAVGILAGAGYLWQWQEARTQRLIAMQLEEVSRTSTQELLDLGGLKEPEMVRIPAGSFMMGAMGTPKTNPMAYSNEFPQHKVVIKEPFRIGKHEVTFAQYDQFAAATGRKPPDDRGWGRDRRPVINVSWEDAVAYAEWLSDMTGKDYRLPTEAEWEYAARAGTTTRYWWGDDINEDGQVWANCDGCGSQWDGEKTAPVGSFDPNPKSFGLYDTAGNVWEWVQDCYHDSYAEEGRPDDGSAWEPEKPEECGRRVIRGGSWYNKPAGVGSANRNGTNPDNRFDTLGFRLAQDL